MNLQIPDHLFDEFILFLDMSAMSWDGFDLQPSERELLDWVRALVTKHQGGYTQEPTDEEKAEMRRARSLI